MNTPVNGKTQGLFKAFECFSRQILFSRTFQDSHVYSSTFQACANPETLLVIELFTHRELACAIKIVIQFTLKLSHFIRSMKTYAMRTYSISMRDSR